MMGSDVEPISIDEMIAALTAIRGEHGNLVLRMADDEPVVAPYIAGEGTDWMYVVITDRD